MSLDTSSPPISSRWRSLRRDVGRDEVLNGFVGVIFSATGPVAIILSVGRSAGLSTAVQASWIAAVFLLNGLLTVLASMLTRQPLVFFWTIPGTVVVGDALQHGATWPEVVGGYLMAAAIMVGISLTGRVEQVMRAVPMSIIMAMVAGVFLPFGTRLVTSVANHAGIAVPMVVAFLLTSAVPVVAARVPPVLAALVTGFIAVLAAGSPVEFSGRWLVEPVLTPPDFTGSILVELAVPLVVTVLVVQNGQGMAVLRGAGHHPPMDRVTGACGVWSLLAAPFGAVSTCLAGPTNAIVVASGERRRHYAGAVVCGVLAVLVGLLAPGMVRTLQSMPEAFVLTLGGLAMLKPLQGAFVAAFDGARAIGAVVTFLVTISGVVLLNIGSAFWGLVAGMLLSWVLDPEGAPSRRR